MILRQEYCLQYIESIYQWMSKWDADVSSYPIRISLTDKKEATESKVPIG